MEKYFFPEAGESWPSIAVTSALRCALLLLVLFLLNSIVELPSSLNGLSLALIAGTVFGSVLAYSRLRFLSVLLLGALLYFGSEAAVQLVALFAPDTREGTLLPFILSLHAEFHLLVFFLALYSTWLFWRVYHYVTGELIAIILICVASFASHRDFNFASAPDFVLDLSWQLGLDPLLGLISVGVVGALLAVLFLTLAEHPLRPQAQSTGRAAAKKVHGGQLAASLLLLSFTIVSLSFISYFLYQKYYSMALSKGANGVGMAERESESSGKSPLGFHSALGSNNQPAALVRLDSDYPENPHSPMLYLREAALSDFDGREMVSAGGRYNRDVPDLRPTDSFVGDEKLEFLYRVPLYQSVYLLSDHEKAFAIDYPISVGPLKNPAPKRFRAAYRAYSAAPAHSPEDLHDALPGNRNWSAETFQHYLETHTDKRYENLAIELTRDLERPAARAFALTEYLNKNAIYTLTPNHDIESGQDPVEPFLFGDMRGYCVHFAHATVYMLRAIGIPARIGTGYLTDLSQAKDGHILLRMSDRHAWAEAYFEEFGWVPFDTQPEQVESHADTEVDSKLLEELMGLVGPDEELLPDELLENEAMVQENDPLIELPSIQVFLWMLFFPLALLFLAKVFLRFGWLLPFSEQWRLRSRYRALLCSLYDLGYTRWHGETNREFFQRISQQESEPELLQAFIEDRYGRPDTRVSRNMQSLFGSTQQYLNSRSGILARAASLLNPRSLGLLF